MNQSLSDLLRQGGYILYSRHGEATIGEDQPNINFGDCSTQRNLSNLGITQAIEYGQKLRYLGIPIYSPIIASPFCRTIETATLAFGRENVVVDPFWYEVYYLMYNLPRETVLNILDTLQLKLEIQPPNGYNRVIIAHGFPDNVGLGEISNMETVIIKPKGRCRGYEVIGKLSFDDLMKMQ